MLQHLKLCLVTHFQGQTFTSYRSLLRKAIEGGVTCIQLRNKDINPAKLREIAIELQSFLATYEIPLIINDDIFLAKEIDAAGVHLGQTDGDPLEARRLLGPQKIIGLSIETSDQLLKANQLDCLSYIAASAVFPSKTKQNIKTLWGLDGLQNMTQNSRYPVMAIGGIEQKNVNDVISHGACGVAVVSAIHDHPNPTLAAAHMRLAIEQSLAEKTNA